MVQCVNSSPRAPESPAGTGPGAPSLVTFTCALMSGEPVALNAHILLARDAQAIVAPIYPSIHLSTCLSVRDTA